MTQIKVGKNLVYALLLTFFFGPLGMFYSTIRGALIMTSALLLLAISTLASRPPAVGCFLTTLVFYYVAALIWTTLAVRAHNARQR